MQMQEESLLWNDLPSVPIEDQIAAAVQGIHPQQTGFQQPGARVVAPSRTHEIDPPVPGANQLPPGTYEPLYLDDLAVARMRTMQKQYFRTRDKSPGGHLEQSKNAERQVDAMIDDFARGSEPNLFTQQPDQYQRNPDGTFTRILRESERVAAATSAFIAPAQDGTLIRCATDIFRGYLELMAVGQMNRNIPAAIHEAVKNAKYLISLTGSK
jgi:hypothetical protein